MIKGDLSLRRDVFRKIVICFVLTVGFLSAQDVSPAKQFNFATWLFDKGEYFRAIGEFERFKYFNSTSKEKDRADFLIGLSYFKAKQYYDAQTSFLKLTNNKEYSLKSRLLAADACFLTKNNIKAFQIYQTVQSENFDVDIKAYGIVGMAWSQLMQRDFVATLAIYDEFLQQYPNHSLTGDVEYLNNSVMNISKFKPLSPVLAGVFSTIIPGVGQIYDKRPGDGIVAFLAVGTLGSASYLLWRYYEHKELAIAFTLATGFFYAGNVYSAWSSAKKYNKLYYQRNLQYLKDTYWRGYQVEKP